MRADGVQYKVKVVRREGVKGIGNIMIKYCGENSKNEFND